MDKIKKLMEETTFGVELEFTGIERDEAIAVIAKVVGGEPQYVGGSYDMYYVRDEQGREWNIVKDASIDNVPMFVDTRCEMVTPPLKLEDLGTLKQIVEKLVQKGAIVNESCGLHIHVDGSNHNFKSLKKLAKMFIKKEDLLYKALNVYERRQKYCYKLKQHQPAFANNVDLAQSMEDLYEMWYGTKSETKKRMRYHDSRYSALNLHSLWYRGTIEFRLFNATLDPEEMEAYIKFSLAMSAKAITARSVSNRKPTAITEWREMHNLLEGLGFKATPENYTIRKHLLKHVAR